MLEFGNLDSPSLISQTEFVCLVETNEFEQIPNE